MQQFAAVCNPEKPETNMAAVLKELSGGQTPNRVICTGHSLGGALATLGYPKDPCGPCCAVLCCAVLCCAVLCCAVLRCAALSWAGLGLAGLGWKPVCCVLCAVLRSSSNSRL